MAERIKAFDWSVTSLGPIAQWSNSLRAAVQMLLASPVPLVMLWGHQGYMVYNDAYSVFAGGRHPFLLGSPVEDGWPEVASFNRNIVDTCLAGGTLSYRDKALVLFRNGVAEDVWMDLYYSPVADDNGVPAGVLAIVIETTARITAERLSRKAKAAFRELTHHLEQRVTDAIAARLAAEEQLRQSQKMEAIGALTGGVAHDFNNVLQIVASNLQILALQERSNENVQKRVTVATAAVRRGANLSSQLLAFARRQPLSPAVINPAHIFNELTELLQRAVGETVAVHLTLPASPWLIHVDRNQLENAILNLAINSRDAMRGDGVLNLIGENVALGSAYCASRDISPGDFVRISVQDNGTGMTPELLERACEPFFTTKLDGQGTGLGLSMAFGFVRQSGGHLEIVSEAGSGTTVQMYFPRSRGIEAVAHEAANIEPVAGRGTILVVEDDQDVRSTVVELLQEFGYGVREAANGDEALLVLKSGPRIDLLFTDVVMPGTIKSADLAVWARAQNPPVPVLFTSGHTRDMISRNGILAPGVTLLQKPYEPETLALMLRRVLSQAPS